MYPLQRLTAAVVLLSSIQHLRPNRRVRSIVRLRPLEGRRRKSRERASSAHRIGQQTRNRHRSDTAWHWRERARHATRLLKRNIANDARLAALTRQPVDADVDHGRARLDPMPTHHLGPPDRREQEIGPAADIWQ